MRIDVSGQQVVIPLPCACCAGKAETELTLAAGKSKRQGAGWNIPYCKHCAKHIKAVDKANLILCAGALASCVVGLILWLIVALLLAILIAGMALMVTLIVYFNLLARAKKRCGGKCACVGKAVKYLGKRDAGHRFEIGSSEFAYAFMVANQRSLGSLGAEARELLESRGNVRKG